MLASEDECLSLRAAAKILPGQPHISTLHRWRLRGVRGVLLETELYGGRRFVTRSALEAFLRATSAAGSGVALPSKTRCQRDAVIRRAKQELADRGI